MNFENFKIINLNNEAEWRLIVKNNFHFPGHTWDYNKLQEINTKLETNLLYFSDKKNNFFFHFIKKKYKKFEFIFSPKGYTGINKSLNERFYKNLILYLKYKGYLTAFISLNPFIKVDDQVYLFKTFKKNIAYIINLHQDLYKLRKNYKKNIIKSIEKAKNDDFQIRKYTNSDYSDVKKIYLESLKNFKIDNFYKTELQEIDFILKEYKNKVCFVATKNDKIYSAIFFFIGSNTCDYYITVSKKNFNFLSSFLIDSSYEYFIDKGIYQINLGGSVANKPGIEQYKKSFKSDEAAFKCLKLILDQEKYNFHCIDGINFPTFKK